MLPSCLADQFTKRYQIAVTLAGGGEGPADLNMRGLAYHAVRELLTNAAKHFSATNITVLSSQESRGRRWGRGNAPSWRGG